MEPTIITGLPHDSPLVKTECFAPIVYCLEIPDLDTGIKYNNEVDQGLSSSLFTENLGDVFKVCIIDLYETIFNLNKISAQDIKRLL